MGEASKICDRARDGKKAKLVCIADHGNRKAHRGVYSDPDVNIVFHHQVFAIWRQGRIKPRKRAERAGERLDVKGKGRELNPRCQGVLTQAGAESFNFGEIGAVMVLRLVSSRAPQQGWTPRHGQIG
jgi:hypothetical protein